MDTPITEKDQQELYEKYAPVPFQRSYSRNSLLLLLSLPLVWNPFHHCEWLYWKYGKADRLHRICWTCRKKEKKHQGEWVKDPVL